MPELVLLTVLLGADPAPAEVSDRDDVILVCNALALQAIRSDRTPPPLAARHLALLHLALFDTVNTIYQAYRPYRVPLRATEPIDPELAAAAAGQRVLASLYPAMASQFDAALRLARTRVVAPRDRTRAETLGRHVADRLLEWRRRDGSDRPGEYRAAADTGIWRPTPDRHASALLPGFGDVTPFGVRDVRRFTNTVPPDLDSTEYRKDLEEVRRLGALENSTRQAGQSVIAWFWDDGPGTCTPVGHWNQIARVVSQKQRLELPENARLFALLNLALADAGIACWECKFRHRLWRPITAIRAESDSRWKPLLETPPFPAYPSGHSTFSAAAATVLTHVFGKEGTSFTIDSDGYPGLRRTYRSFWQAAEEVGKSRIYGGIHFECDNRDGRALGKAIAADIVVRYLLPEDGPPRLKE